MKKRISIVLLVVFLLSCFTIFVYADNEVIDAEQETEEVELVLPALVLVQDKVEEIEKMDANGELVKDEEGNVIKEEKSTLTFYDAETEEELFNIEDEQYSMLLEDVFNSVREDARKGLDELANSKVTVGHIKLVKWGKFLSFYYGKNERDFPLGDIAFEYKGQKFAFKNTKEIKNLVLNVFVPKMIDDIVEISQEYPAKKYVLNSESGMLLKDFVCDTSNVVEKEVVYPLQKGETYQFFNVGSNMCMGLDSEYVDILRGYIENYGNYRRVESNDGTPGCVSILSYIVCLRDVTDYTLADKELADFMLYNNLAVALDTKELIDANSGIITDKKLFYSDYKLDENTLVVATISDSIVVIQPKYLECFEYNGVQSNFGSYIDATEMITNNADYFVVSSTGQKVPIKNFEISEGILDTRLGNSPFLIYYTSNHQPYDKLVNFAYNQRNIYFNRFENGDERAENFVDSIRTELKEKGRSADFDAYMKEAGQKTDGQKMIIKIVIIAVIILAIAGIAVFLVLRYKKVNAESTQTNLTNNDNLFTDDDDDDDDDDDGSFELK